MNEEELKAAQEALSHVRKMKEQFDAGLITEAKFLEFSEKANIAPAAGSSRPRTGTLRCRCRGRPTHHNRTCDPVCIGANF